MLIRVLLEDGEEGLFNADCLAAHLLDAIKRKLKLPRTDNIDLCTSEGEVKELYCHKENNAAKFFTLRELCLAVRVQEKDTSLPRFIPILSEYTTNEHFLSVLNSKESKDCCLHMKLKHPPPSAKSTLTPPDSNKAKLGAGKTKKRRNSAFRA